MPALKWPLDLFVYQEILYATRPAVIVAELDLDPILARAVDRHSTRPVPVYPPIKEDLAFVLDRSVAAGKVREVSALLEGLAIQVVGPRDVEVEALPPEDGATFLDNAVIKAAAVWSRAGLPSMGDDSGLEVAALDGAPGIRSARFAGEGQDDAANISKLLSALQGKADRRARFVCWAACVLGRPRRPAGRTRTHRRGSPSSTTNPSSVERWPARSAARAVPGRGDFRMSIADCRLQIVRALCWC